MEAIQQYLSFVYEEAVQRGYRFDGGKIDRHAGIAKN
jgi:hypothetical protein